MWKNTVDVLAVWYAVIDDGKMIIQRKVWVWLISIPATSFARNAKRL